VAGTDFETCWEMTTMADLRTQLRRIESASPPDLWDGIEARARQERPQMDTDVTSIDAFREPGWDRRRRLAAALVAAAVVTATVVAIWESFHATPIRKVPIGTDLPEGWVRCTNNVLGYSIGYPGNWHTTNVFDGTADPANVCQWFSPTPFDPQGNVVVEGWGYPLELATRTVHFDDLRGQETDPEAVDVLVDEDLFVEGHRAVQLEFETLTDVIGEPGLHYEYLIELDPETTLIVHTTATRGVAGVYAENKVVLDYAVETLNFLSAVPSSPAAS
jgi:hypothetical protein